MISSGKFEIPYYVYSAPDHNLLKEKILQTIESGIGEESVKNFESISKSDWYTNYNPKFFKENFKDRKDSYFGLLESHIVHIIEKIIPDKNKSKLQVSNGWFHQYNKLDYYWWHNHPDCRWSLIYYLELSEDGPVTEFENFYGNTIFPNVKEGDFLIFPGWIKHRSPPNLSKNRKTILSFNIVEIR